MLKTIEAVYEDGVFRPLNPLKGLKQHQRISLSIKKSPKKKHPLEGLCGILPDQDADEISKIIGEEFEKIDIDEW